MPRQNHYFARWSGYYETELDETYEAGGIIEVMADTVDNAGLKAGEEAARYVRSLANHGFQSVETITDLDGNTFHRENSEWVPSPGLGEFIVSWSADAYDADAYLGRSTQGTYKVCATDVEMAQSLARAMLPYFEGKESDIAQREIEWIKCSVDATAPE